MPRKKCHYDYEVQGYYGYGWEMVTAEDTMVDAKKRLKEYRENERGVPFRIRKVRECD